MGSSSNYEKAAFKLFSGIAQECGLKYSTMANHNEPELELFEFPVQKGLQFSLSLFVSGDALFISASDWCMEFFPYEEIETQYHDNVVGLVKGTHRVVEYYMGKNSEHSYKAVLQAPSGNNWSTEYTTTTWPMIWFWPCKKILQNASC